MKYDEALDFLSKFKVKKNLYKLSELSSNVRFFTKWMDREQYPERRLKRVNVSVIEFLYIVCIWTLYFVFPDNAEMRTVP